MSNKTQEYLQRVLFYGYDQPFSQEVCGLSRYTGGPILGSMAGIYILDVLYVRRMNMWPEPKPCFYIVFNTMGVQRDGVYVDPEAGRAAFEAFMEYLRSWPMYAYDYALPDDQHMVIVNFPERYRHAYDMFLQNHYSNMYTRADLEALKFKPILKDGEETVISLIYAVLTRNAEYGRIKVLRELEEKFGVTEVPDRLLEYDIPWLIRNEVYHHELLTDDEKRWLWLCRVGVPF